MGEKLPYLIDQITAMIERQAERYADFPEIDGNIGAVLSELLRG